MNILRTLKRVTDGFEKQGNHQLKSLNLTITQCAVLGFLQSKERCEAPIKEIERAFHVSQATMQGTLARLAKKGLIALKDDAVDKRVKHATLTADGLTLYMQSDEKRRNFEAYLFSEFTQEEVEQLMSLLLRLQEKVE